MVHGRKEIEAPDKNRLQEKASHTRVYPHDMTTPAPRSLLTNPKYLPRIDSFPGALSRFFKAACQATSLENQTLCLKELR
jgi:hypothetical protein